MVKSYREYIMNKLEISFAKLFVKFVSLFKRFYIRMLKICKKQEFAKCGKNLVFNPENSDFIYSHIFIGNDVHIGPKACFMSSVANIYIGNKVVFGPNVSIRGAIIFLTYLVDSYMILQMKIKDLMMMQILL